MSKCSRSSRLTGAKGARPTQLQPRLNSAVLSNSRGSYFQQKCVFSAQKSLTQNFTLIPDLSSVIFVGPGVNGNTMAWR